MLPLTRSDWPSMYGESVMSDFFDGERFSPWLSQNVPAVNIRETDKYYEVELSAPGYNKKDFNISIDNGLLIVSAERKEEKERKEENYTRREFSSSSFSRSFNLPLNANEEKLQAKYEDGILRLTIEKLDESKGKTKKAIEIK